MVETVPEFPRTPEADHMVGAKVPGSHVKWPRINGNPGAARFGAVESTRF
jgi:hypothetical protein